MEDTGVEVSHILKRAQPSRMSNITQQEISGLKDLQKNENVLILPLVKGNSVVVMNKSDYQEKIKWMFRSQLITDNNRTPLQELHWI